MRKIIAGLSAAFLLCLAFAAQAQMNLLTGAGGKFKAGVTAGPMVTPIMAAFGAAPSATAANYSALNGAPFGASTSRDVPVPIAGTLNGLTVRFPTTVVSGQYVVTLYLNGSATGLACTVTSTTCTNNTSVAVAAGDLLMWQVCPGTHSGVAGSCTPGTPTAQAAAIQVSAVFTSTNNGESFVAAGVVGVPNSGANSYLNIGAPESAASWATTEANQSSILPTNGSIDKLYVESSNAPGAGRSLVYTVRKNGAATGITCTMTGTGSGAGITRCNDTTNAASFSAGDTMSLEAAPSGTPTGGNTRFAVRWVPTIAGESIFPAVQATALSTGAVRFANVSAAGASTTEVLFSLVPVAFTWKNLYFGLDVAPGAGTPSRNLINRTGTGTQADGTMTVTLTTTTQGSDLVHTYSASVNDLINFKLTPANTPAATVYWRASSVAYIP